MRIIGVISGKGGVGKTTTVANVGTALASAFNRRVVLVDGNPTTPDLSLHLGVYSIAVGLKDVLAKRFSIKDALMPLPSGVRLLPSSVAVGDEVEIQGLGTLLRGLGEYEFVFVDSPPGLGKGIEPVLELCDEVIIVTNLEVPAVTEAMRAIATAKRARAPIKGMVLNAVRGASHELSVMEVESVFDAPVIAVVPEDLRVRESIAAGKPVVLSHPSSPAALEFKRLAASLIGMRYPTGLIEKLGSWLRGPFRPSEEEKEVIPRTEAPQPQTRVATEAKEITIKEPLVQEDVTATPELTEEAMREKQKHARRLIVEGTLARLEENYRQGRIREQVYSSLKAKYLKELEKL